MSQFTFPKPNKSIILMLVIAVIMIFYPNISINAAKEALEAFVQIVLPSLFPFIVCTNIILNLGGAQLLSVIFKPFMKIFSLPGEIGISYATSLAAGYPSGLNSLAKQFTRMKTNELLSASILCSNVSPMFVIGAVGSLLSNMKLPWLILLSHYLGGIITAFIASLTFKKCGFQRVYVLKQNNTGFTQALDNAIQNASFVMLRVCACIVIMRVFSALILASPMAYILQNINIVDMELIIRGFFEMADGCIYAAAGVDIITSCMAICVIISFGGISVILQSTSYLNKLNIKTKTYILYKFFHAVISALICFFMLNIIPVSMFVSSEISTEIITTPEFYNHGMVVIMIILSVYVICQCPRIWVRFWRTISKFR